MTGAPPSSLAMLALLVAVLAWAAQRIRQAERFRHADPAELGLIDRVAATDYRTQLQDQLRTLDELPARLASMDIPEEKRREARERIATQRAALARELTWVEERLRTLG